MRNVYLVIFLVFYYACSELPSDSTQQLESALELEDTPEHIRISNEGKPILSYQKAVASPSFAAPQHYRRSGFIHPIYTPAGRILTDDFPVGHTHQHAFFHAWTNTTFQDEKVDFWNQQNELGTIEHTETINHFANDSTTGFEVELNYISLKHGPVLAERWIITVYDLPEYHVWDLALKQENISSDTLFINDYHYGGLGIRMSKQWNIVDSSAFRSTMKVITNQGIERDSANHTRPLWLCAYGKVDNTPVGIVILDHPTNFRYPQPVRVHSEMPYFCKAPMVGKAFFIPPKGTYSARYRVIAFDGDPEPLHFKYEQERFAEITF